MEETITITRCDLCANGAHVAGLLADGRGAYVGGFATITQEVKVGDETKVLVLRRGADSYGWEERDFGHVCPECVEEEKAAAEEDAEFETEAGAAFAGTAFNALEEELQGIVAANSLDPEKVRAAVEKHRAELQELE